MSTMLNRTEPAGMWRTEGRSRSRSTSGVRLLGKSRWENRRSFIFHFSVCSQSSATSHVEHRPLSTLQLHPWLYPNTFYKLPLLTWLGHLEHWTNLWKNSEVCLTDAGRVSAQFMVLSNWIYDIVVPEYAPLRTSAACHVLYWFSGYITPCVVF